MYKSIFLFILSCWLNHGLCNDQLWLLINTKTLTLEVKKGQKSIEIFNNIAIGRSGSGFKKYQGDDVTPLGTYKIGWINKESQYHIFYGFDYPSITNAKQALKRGLIDKRDYDKVLTAHRLRQVPPQNTTLGGRIGIHGLGRADKQIHEIVNWTHGCIALTNEQINVLDQWIIEGMEVRIE